MSARDLLLRVQQQRPVPLDAQLHCRSGQLTVLLGPSGSGKSTLLRMIAGLDAPASGSIECDGHRWFDHDAGVRLPSRNRRVGYVPQSYGLFPHLDALGNICAGLTHLPADAAAQRAKDWLARVGLAGLAARRPSELSGGQQQRVALARALAREPSVLLLDEPFSALDGGTRESLYLELVTLKRELQVPALLVTHDLGEALLLADQLVLLDGGNTLQAGPPREVLHAPCNVAAARMLGIRNIFEGVVSAQDPVDGTTTLAVGPHQLVFDFQARFQPGDTVHWMITAGAVRLPPKNLRPVPERPNRLNVIIQKLLPFGDEMRLYLQAEGFSAALQCSAPQELVTELELAEGQRVEVLLRASGMRIF